MGKRRLSLQVRIPAYRGHRNAWRESIHAEAVRAAQSRGVEYQPEDKLELSIKLYLDESGLGFHDVDNRLKDIMDALQGRAGGPKSKHTLKSIIPNDRQIFKATIEKLLPPVQSRGMGRLIIRKYHKAANKPSHAAPDVPA